MPFKSLAQRRKFYALKAQGKMDQKTIDEWEKDTPKNLPEKLAFRLGFEKEAKPRWIKFLAENDPIDSKFIDKLKTISNKIREIRPLGKGGEQVADEVFHPQHGIIVRKIPLIKSMTTKDLGEAVTKSKNWEKVKKITEGKGPFAHIIAKEGPVSYYEKAKSYHTDIHKRIAEERRALIKTRESLQSKIMSERKALQEGHGNRDKFFDLKENLYNIEDKITDTKRVLNEAPTFSAQDKLYIDKVREKFPHLHDINHRNVVGGKIVDMEFDHGVSYIDSKIKIPQDIFAKKVLLGRSTPMKTDYWTQVRKKASEE